MIAIIPTFFIYFLCGVVFIEAIPILEACITVIVQFLTMLQGFIAIVVTKQSAAMAKIKSKALDDGTPIRTIGFSISDDEDEIDHESEDE